MSKTMHEETRAEIDISAYLSRMVYDSEYFDIDDGVNFQFTIPGSDRTYEIIATSVSEGYDIRKLAAFVVRDNAGNVYIVYRGTGDGKWIDNAIGMFEDSPIQQEALKFYNGIVEKEIKNNPKFTGDLIVTGHSKGGNLSQYVTVASEYGQLVDHCYSIDGQGFSQEVYERFLQQEDFADRIEKMYSINGQNDYVDPLGIVIIPWERTFFVKNDEEATVDMATFFHRIDDIMHEGGLNWDYTEVDGERVYNYDLEAGPVNKLMREISANMMGLGEEELEDCAVTIMFLVECAIGNRNEIAQGYKNSATFEEILGCINIGLPLVLNTLRNSDHTDAVLELVGLDIKKDHFLVDPICDLLIHLAEDLTLEELEGLVLLYGEVSDYAKSKQLTLGGLADYIADDPIRLLDIYSSLDLSKKNVNDAVVKIVSAGAVGKLLLTMVFPNFSVMVDFAAAAGMVALVANHIKKNWDVICNKIKQTVEWIKDEIARFYNELKRVVETGIINWVSGVCATAETLITRGERVVNKLIDNATAFWESLKEKTVETIRKNIAITNPVLYIIASKVYRAVAEPVKINISAISDCVERMNRLAKRVANIDTRLDSLYWTLAKKNIEQGEGLFTSLANIYNLFRADLNVDEGAAIKRKAQALSDLYDGYKDTDAWVLQNLPKKI